jgi:hypothetical protein
LLYFVSRCDPLPLRPSWLQDIGILLGDNFAASLSLEQVSYMFKVHVWGPHLGELLEELVQEAELVTDLFR